MTSILPINAHHVLHFRGVESKRVEFKASWDSATTGCQELRTVCVLEKDYHNLNGGYVVIGVEVRDGGAVLPLIGAIALRSDDSGFLQK